jgi:hypothetical protein
MDEFTLTGAFTLAVALAIASRSHIRGHVDRLAPRMMTEKSSSEDAGSVAKLWITIR